MQKQKYINYIKIVLYKTINIFLSNSVREYLNTRVNHINCKKKVNINVSVNKLIFLLINISYLANRF